MNYNNRMTEISSCKYTDLISPSIFAMCPKIWAKEFGIIPRSSGIVRTPSMVNVFPVPVCPYAKIVPGNTTFSISNSKQITFWVYLEIGNRNIKNWFQFSSVYKQVEFNKITCDLVSFRSWQNFLNQPVHGKQKMVGDKCFKVCVEAFYVTFIIT